jgi:hypothetical protein
MDVAQFTGGLRMREDGSRMKEACGNRRVSLKNHYFGVE